MAIILLFVFLLTFPHGGLFPCVFKFWIVNSIFRTHVKPELRVCIPPEKICIFFCQYVPGIPNQDLL